MSRRSRRNQAKAPQVAVNVSASEGGANWSVIPSIPTGPTNAGIRVTERSALGITTVFACVSKIANTCAAFPLYLYREDERDNIERVRKHPIMSLLDQPNEFQTPFEFKQFVYTCLALRGNAYAYIHRNGNGYADALIPIHPDHVTVYVGGSRENQELFYRVRIDLIGDVVDLTADQCLHFRIFGPSPYIGIDPLTMAREAFGLAIAEERHGARVFSNGVSTSGVLEVPGKLKDGQRNEIRNDIQRMHSGANAHNVLILEGAWKYTPIGVTNENAQFLESRKFQAEEICRIFGVPPHMVGVMDRAGITSIEMLNRTFYDTGLMPYLKNVEQRTDAALLTSQERGRGMYTAHDTHAFLGADVKTRYESYGIGRQWGWMSVNDIRRREDLSPIPGGDVYLQPLNMGPAGAKPESDPQPAPPTDTPSGDPPKGEE